LSNIVEGRATADPRRAQALLASMDAERPGCGEGIDASMAQTRRACVPPTGVVDETH
jgi:hypothetical protein